MASSSSQVKYDVFLSFRGEDTRDNFTSHLSAALRRRSIFPFIDDQLERGDEISPSLLNAIKGSKISIIIFSKGYASSTWCLQELVEILNCRRMSDHVVIPVFYHVDPSDVRKQTGTYGDAFSKHEERYMEKKDMLQRWRNALTEAANLSGFDSNSIRPESKLVETIIGCISEKLNDKSSSGNKNLVGVAMKIQKIKSLLFDNSNKVCKVGLWGMGGIGKTILAEAVFNEISSQFEASYFARNVTEASYINQLCHLQKEFLYTTLKDEHLDMRLTFTKERLGCKRVLIVFDDVTDSKQITELIGDPEDLGFGSQIIITTRDKQVLKICGLDDSTIYEVKGLGHDDSLRLFKQHAFKQNHQIDEVYLKLSERVISYTKGLPLALKVLGGHLLGREKLDWESALDDLQKSPYEGIQKVLKISYDGLSNKEKTLFLDITCFFKGWDKYLVGSFSSHIGIKVLVDKALITIPFNKTIGMHDLIQAMGWEVVQQESSNKLGERNRLWRHDDVYRVLKKNLGTDKIQGMLFNMVQMKEIHLNQHAFSKMANLRFLIVKHLYSREDNKIHGFDNIEFDFSELECFCWNYYPFPSLPLKFDPDNLVVLEMQNSNLKQLWTGIKDLAHLKYIDLSYSEHLFEVPDLSEAPNLERLILEDCTSLLEITPSSQNLNKLVELNLRNCKSLMGLPVGIQSKSLRDVILSGCSNLNTAPRISCNMERLCLDGTAIKNLSSSIESPSRLVELNLKDCLGLKSLPSNVGNLTSLRKLDLSGLSNLKMVPKIPSEIVELSLDGTAIKELSSSIGKASSMITLSLRNCSSLESLPNTIFKLKSLKYLCISGCSKLEGLPDDLGKLESLEGIEASGIIVKELPSVMVGLSALRFLRRLELNYCSITELPNNIDNLSLLVHLELEGNNFESVPTNIMNLSMLRSLNIRFCDRLQSLPKLPRNIKNLLADGCKLVKELSGFTNLITRGPHRRRLNLFNCVSLDWDAIKNILTDSILDTFSSKNFHFLYKRYRRRGIEICYPGSDIPEWFNIQSSGSVIKLPQGSLNEKVLGLAYCLIVEVEDNCDQCNFFGFHCMLRLGHPFAYRVTTYEETRILTECIKSDHAFVKYDRIHWELLCTEDIKFICDTEAIISFTPTISSRFTGKNWIKNIKKCGIRLLFTEEFKETMKGSGCSIHDEDRFKSSNFYKGESNLGKKRRKEAKTQGCNWEMTNDNQLINGRAANRHSSSEGITGKLYGVEQMMGTTETSIAELPEHNWKAFWRWSPIIFI